MTQKIISSILFWIAFLFVSTLLVFCLRYVWFSIDTVPPERWIICSVCSMVFSFAAFAYSDINQVWNK